MLLNRKKVTSATLRYCDAKSAGDRMETVMKAEIDDVETLPHFDRIHFGPHSTTEECLRLYKHFQGNGEINGNGWRHFPDRTSREADYGTWLENVAMAIKRKTKSRFDRTLVDRGNLTPKDSTDNARPDISLIDTNCRARSKYRFAIMHIVGELKSALVSISHNARTDGTMSTTESQLSKYVRHIFRTQETRHFVLGFILAGPLMRVYQFDRLGLTSGNFFDVNQDPIRFIRTMVAFMRMDETQLGHDPTIRRTDSARPSLPFLQRRQLTISLSNEDLTVERCLSRLNSVSGRGTTCWLAHNAAGDRFLVKDSWQFSCREAEGSLFKKATSRGTINLVKYESHELVHQHGDPYSVKQHLRTLPTSANSQSDRQFHRVVFWYREAKSLEKAGSSVALLRAFRDALVGHRSLHQRDIIHRDISMTNIMVNVEPSEPYGFLIDLDLAIDLKDRPTLSPPHMSGSRLFMGVRRLMLAEDLLDSILERESRLETASDPADRAKLTAELQKMRSKYDQAEDDSYLNDLESFFWVLFWVSCNYDVDGKWIGVTELNTWPWKSTRSELSGAKVAVLTWDFRLAKIPNAETGLPPNKTYKDVRPCVLSLRRLFSLRELTVRLAAEMNTSPDFAVNQLDNKNLYLQMVAIIDQELDRLGG